MTQSSGRPAGTGSVVPALGRPPVGLHLIRPLAGDRARLAELEQRRAHRRQPGPVPDVMPAVGGVLVAVASFPASLGAGELVAAVRGCLPTGLAGLAGCLGKRVACHLRDPLRCRLAVRGMAGRRCLPSWRWSRQWDVVALTAYARPGPAIPDHLPGVAPASTAAVSSRAQPQDSVRPRRRARSCARAPARLAAPPPPAAPPADRAAGRPARSITRAPAQRREGGRAVPHDPRRDLRPRRPVGRALLGRPAEDDHVAVRERVHVVRRRRPRGRCRTRRSPGSRTTTTCPRTGTTDSSGTSDRAPIPVQFTTTGAATEASDVTVRRDSTLPPRPSYRRSRYCRYTGMLTAGAVYDQPDENPAGSSAAAETPQVGSRLVHGGG